MDECSLEQQDRESDDYTWIVRNWSPSHSGTGSYDRQAGRQMKKCCKSKKFFFCLLNFNAYLGIVNRFLALIKLYQYMYGQFFLQILLQGYLSRCVFVEAIHFLVDPYY